MVVLIVDDQISVVSGIFCGINWGKIGITKVYKAYNVYEAKSIITKNKIDILLCDIEMPMESGLDLYSWIREKKYGILCIFLTAYADFMYAQKAVKLNVFDYILQPAPYGEIEKVLQRAVRKLRRKQATEDVYSYGKMVYKTKEKLIDAIFQPIFTDTEHDIANDLDDIRKLGIRLKPDSLLYLALMTIGISENSNCRRVNTENIVLQQFSAVNQFAVFFTVTGRDFGLIVFSDTGELIPYDTYKNLLQTVRSKLEENCGTDSAVYTTKSIPLNRLREAARKILAYKKNMLENSSGLFDADEILPSRNRYPLPNMRHWKDLIRDGRPEIIQAETETYLEEIPSDVAGAAVLKQFYQEFMQLVSVVLAEHGVAVTDLFDDKSALTEMLESYKSVDKMKNLVRYFCSYFEQQKKGNEDDALIKTVIEFIEENISEDLRRDEIASYVHLNPSYLSRIFKKETGKSLKEFITEEKMDFAQTLLRSTNLTVSMIAAKVGYTNFSLFSQNYRRTKGKLPSEERMIKIKES